MTTYTFEGKITALSSISHGGGESFGINQKLRREKFVQPDGSVRDVPVISGNSIRGLLRDKGMMHMCGALGYGTNDATGEVSGLPLPAFYFLFSGGSLSGGSKSVNIEEARRMRELIPLSSVFGGALGGQIMNGKLKVNKAIPICRETMHLLPEAYRPANPAGIYDYLQEEMYTRKDDEKSEKLRGIIDQGQRKLIEIAREAKELKRGTKDDVATETGQSQQMMYYVETFAPGTQFHWRLTLEDVTPLEFDALVTTLMVFSRSPYIGGKSAIGLGEIAVKFDRWMEIDSRAHVVSKEFEIGLAPGSAYLAHIDSHREEIRKHLAAF
jgi:CRISPR type IV-associated protein Csf2